MADKYSVSGSLSGRGSRERNQKIDEMTDQIVAGKGQSSGAQDTASTTDTTSKKPVYTPSDTERSTRTYGAPMGEQLVNKPQHDRRGR